MIKPLNPLLRLGFICLISGLGCGKNDSRNESSPPDTAPQETTTRLTPEPLADGSKDSSPAKPSPQEIKKLQARMLEGVGEVIAMVTVKSASLTMQKVEAAGGRVIYDPNLGRGDGINFLVLALPPEKLIDEDFVKSMSLSSLSLPGISPTMQIKPLEQVSKLGAETSLALEGINSLVTVPTAEVGVDALRNLVPGAGRGKNVTIAVIDTGVDASHHVFQDRVVYWSDETQERRIKLTKTEVGADGKFDLSKKQVAQLPDGLRANTKEVYIGAFDEDALGRALDESQRSSGADYVDINSNARGGECFVVAVYRQGEQWLAAFDENADGKLDDGEWARKIVDFNLWRAGKVTDITANGFIEFKATNRTRHFPFRLDFDAKSGAPTHAEVLADVGAHGTHVAGIAAGNSSKIMGAAPDAKIMSIRVCGESDCSNEALIRGLVKAFYNEQGLVPDIVNISLGSAQEYSATVFDLLIRDLSSKFGTIFFISASNSGPGYRTINSLGALSPAIFVGAHASRRTLMEHYNLHVGTETSQNLMLNFSSLGPSYNGELRPNIVAPGSALSSVPLTQNRSSMFNGTSMSSPLAAGAVAALFSGLQENAEYQALRRIVEQQRAYFVKLWRKQADLPASQTQSLHGYVQTVRQVLEDSAERTTFNNKSLVEIGHGLLRVDSAFEQMSKVLPEVLNENKDAIRAVGPHWEFNNNAKAVRLYNRSNVIEDSITLKVTLASDGEASEAELDQMEIEQVTVKLAQIQEQAADGTVRTMDLDKLSSVLDRDKLPFSIANSGSRVGELESSLVLNNGRKTSFVSKRNIRQMKPGYTYIARYDVFQFGRRINTLLDIVHQPIEFTEAIQSYLVPSFGPSERRLSAAFLREGVTIKATTNHRYFVAITEADTRVRIDMALPEGVRGNVDLSIFDPDGRQIGGGLIRRVDEVNEKRPHQTFLSPYLEKKGLYELVLSNNNGSYLFDTSYDLLIKKVRYVVSKKTYSLSPGEERILAFGDISGDEPIDEVKVTLNERVVKLGDVDLVPNHRVFKYLDVPAAFKEQTNFTLRLDLSGFSEALRAWWLGRLDHRLYVAKGDAPEVLVSGSNKLGSSQKRSFYNIDLSRGVYAGIEYIPAINDQGNNLDAFKKVPLEMIFSDVAEEEQAKVSAIDSDHRFADVYRLKAPEKLTQPNSFLRGRGLVRLRSGAEFEFGVEVHPK